MSTTNRTNEYLLLLRNAHWGKDLSPQDAQDGLVAFGVWLEGLRARNLLKAGQPLGSEGHYVTVAMDGPFVETKEAVGGYLLLETESYEAACEAAKACPVLKHGMEIEVRPIIRQCDLIDELGMSSDVLPTVGAPSS
ncbi:MAG: hypothetical protein JST51_19725 [Armatimonadetes bacterium]|nr:hypothetical protein [Armatimonadota bacterium]